MAKRSKVAKSVEPVIQPRIHSPRGRKAKYQGTSLDFGSDALDPVVVEKKDQTVVAIVEAQTATIEKKIVERTEAGKKVFCVVSDKTGKGFGCYSTKVEASQRLAQIEQFGEDSAKPKADGKKPPPFPPKKSAKKSEVPELLTWQAVRDQSIPSDGTSGLVESLEKDVPPQYRYWKCENRAEALRVHEALIKSELFNESTICEVDGSSRRAVSKMVEKLFVAPEYGDGDPVVPPVVRPIEKAASILPDGDEQTTLFDETITAAIGLDEVLKKCASITTDFVIASEDTPEAREMIKGQIFKVWAHDDLIFTTNVELEDSDAFEWIQKSRIDSILEKAFCVGRNIRLVKAKEERIVFGVVLEPEEVDAQNDTISNEEIRQAAHKFMEDFRVSGIQHKEFVKDSRISILESFIAPVDFDVEGQTVKAGSWLMKKRIKDDQLWASVKKGEFTGFSIGGSAIRKPIK